MTTRRGRTDLKQRRVSCSLDRPWPGRTIPSADSGDGRPNTPATSPRTANRQPCHGVSDRPARCIRAATSLGSGGPRRAETGPHRVARIRSKPACGAGSRISGRRAPATPDSRRRGSNPRGGAPATRSQSGFARSGERLRPSLGPTCALPTPAPSTTVSRSGPSARARACRCPGPRVRSRARRSGSACGSGRAPRASSARRDSPNRARGA